LYNKVAVLKSFGFTVFLAELAEGIRFYIQQKAVTMKSNISKVWSECEQNNLTVSLITNS